MRNLKNVLYLVLILMVLTLSGQVLAADKLYPASTVKLGESLARTDLDINGILRMQDKNSSTTHTPPSRVEGNIYTYTVNSETEEEIDLILADIYYFTKPDEFKLELKSDFVKLGEYNKKYYLNLPENIQKTNYYSLSTPVGHVCWGSKLRSSTNGYYKNFNITKVIKTKSDLVKFGRELIYEKSLYHDKTKYILVRDFTSSGREFTNSIKEACINQGYDEYTYDLSNYYTVQEIGLEFDGELLDVDTVQDGFILRIAAGDKGIHETTEESAAVDKKLNEVISTIIRSGMTDTQKVEAVRSWLASNVKYDGNKVNFTAYHGLFGKKRTVCMGYSLITYKMFKKAGLDSHIVHSVNHAFNMVKVNNQWYFIDFTGIRYDNHPPLMSRNTLLKPTSRYMYRTLKDKDLFGNILPNTPETDFGKYW